jgi:diguanylate cyclase (GGDEF)-like protein
MAEPTEPQPIAWDRDVLALIPPTKDILHLESVACLAADSNPLMRLALWCPAEDDEIVRDVLLAFGEDLLAAMWKNTQPRPTRSKVPPVLGSDRIDLDLVDQLTGLYNRAFFWLRLEEEVRRHSRLAQPVVVVLLEPDQVEGERPLGDLADVLLKHTSGLHVICRYDARIFGVILVNTSRVVAGRYVEHIRRALASGDLTGGRRMTVHVGIGSLPGDPTPSVEGLVRRVLMSLEVAKRAGRTAPGAPRE